MILENFFEHPGVLSQLRSCLLVRWQGRLRLEEEEEARLNTVFVFGSHVVHQIVFCGKPDESGLLNEEYAHIVNRERLLIKLAISRIHLIISLSNKLI